MSMYIDVHVLQTVPPSCVNRDDTGSPKTAVYGGAVRARVSSQAWKHAMRKKFIEILNTEDVDKYVGVRTKDLVGLVAQEIIKIDPSIKEKKANTMASKALKAAKIDLKAESTKKDDEDKKEMATALFFMSKRQAKAIAKLACNDTLDKKEWEKALKTALKENPSVDIALFGRMAASDPTLNYDATAQVAHAISTHAVQNEYDYFTAIDDMQKEDNAGAGHLGTVEFNSSTLYRYANVNISELANTLKKDEDIDIGELIKVFANAFICSMPTGKENSFANGTMPDTVYITIRKDQPINLCGAFEKPIRSNNGYVAESKKRLVEYAQKVYKKYDNEPECAFCISDSFDSIAKKLSLPELLEAIKEEVNNCIGKD